jgi:hypothetical protein
MSSSDSADWWPDHVRQVFVAIHSAMRSARLYPEDLHSISGGEGAILPDHVVTVTHVSGKEPKGRKGRYMITITGPRYAGGWAFFSGQLERLALDSARKS